MLKGVSEMPQFHFHPRCKPMQLSHLCFADDLILCCKGEFTFVYLLLQAFKLFSESSSLKANVAKSSLFCCRMTESDVQRVVDVSGLARSSLPFRYLGVPIYSERILVAQCDGLVKKMIAKIRMWSSRKLSYSARALLINTILMSLHMSWHKSTFCLNVFCKALRKYVELSYGVGIHFVKGLEMLLGSSYVVARLQ